MNAGFVDMLAMFSGAEALEWLDSSNFDNLIEIDIPNDLCIDVFHVPGKYCMPVLDASYRETYRYALENMVHPDDCEAYAANMNPDTMLENIASSNHPGYFFFKLRYKMQNGSWRWVEKYLISGTRFGLRDGVVRSYLFDIQNQVDRETGGAFDVYSGSHEALDEKTGLRREGAFTRESIRRLRADGAIGGADEPAPAGAATATGDVGESQAAAQQGNWCVIAIDLEHFRLFNDWYGREKGDELLARTGVLLAEVERESGGVAGYFGQDDFCLLAPYDQGKIGRLHKDLIKLFTDMNTAVGFRPMLGVCKVEDDVPMLDLIDRARLALENARRDIKVGICLYESKMQEKTNKEYEILLDFKEGLRNREFQVYLQPQCRISSGKVVGAEALARWRKADGTVVSPADFIPVLEKYGFVADLDCYIWEEVCRLIREWIDAGHESIPVSVNVSQADFYTIDVPDYLNALVSKYGIPKHLLKVEITESAFAESVRIVADTTQRLRDSGFLVLMDDFGSGYSSLNMLSGLNVDVIKLDAGFFRMGEEDVRKGTRIVESIVNMAKNLSLPIITEGVETKEQVEFLEGLGCRFIQGFYYYRPMPVPDFLELIGSGTQIDERGFSSRANEQIGVREFFDESLYNDAMLNNILGAVAFCSWCGDQVELVRFNDQLNEEVGLPGFDDLRMQLQDFVLPEDRERLLEVFQRASEDLMNGAKGTIGFQTSKGKVLRFALRAYYLDDKGAGKLFFVSVKNVTNYAEARLKSRIMAEYYPYSIVLNRQHKDGWHFLVAINGLGNLLGFSQDEIQAEFDDGSFLQRMKPGTFDEARAIASAAVKEKRGFDLDFELRGNDGRFLPLHVKADYVETGADNIKHIMTISVR